MDVINENASPGFFPGLLFQGNFQSKVDPEAHGDTLDISFQSKTSRMFYSIIRLGAQNPRFCRYGIRNGFRWTAGTWKIKLDIDDPSL